MRCRGYRACRRWGLGGLGGVVVGIGGRLDLRVRERGGYRFGGCRSGIQS